MPRVHGRPRSVVRPAFVQRCRRSRARSCRPITNDRYIQRTVSTSSGGPGTSTTRSVWMLLCSPRVSSPLAVPAWSIKLRRNPYPGGPPWRITELDQSALPSEDLDGELSAVFAGHRALDALDDGGDRASVILELLGAILHADAGALADVFVIGALVRILKPAPAADVVDEDGREIGSFSFERPRSAASTHRGRPGSARSFPRRHRCARSRCRAARRIAASPRLGSPSSISGARWTSGHTARRASTCHFRSPPRSAPNSRPTANHPNCLGVCGRARKGQSCPTPEAEHRSSTSGQLRIRNPL